MTWKQVKRNTPHYRGLRIAKYGVVFTKLLHKYLDENGWINFRFFCSKGKIKMEKTDQAFTEYVYQIPSLYRTPVKSLKLSTKDFNGRYILDLSDSETNENCLVLRLLK